MFEQNEQNFRAKYRKRHGGPDEVIIERKKGFFTNEKAEKKLQDKVIQQAKGKGIRIRFK